MRPELLSPGPAGLAAADLDRLVRHLDAGGLAALPVESGFMFAGAADRPEVVRAVYAAKQRPGHMPLTVAFGSLKEAAPWVCITPLAERLAERHLPGSLTLVLDLAPGSPAPAELLGGGSTLGIRVPLAPLLAQLFAVRPGGLIATSANPSGVDSWREQGAMIEALAPRMERPWLVVEQASFPKGEPSTLADARGPTPRILRQGALRLD